MPAAGPRLPAGGAAAGRSHRYSLTSLSRSVFIYWVQVLILCCVAAFRCDTSAARVCVSEEADEAAEPQ